MLGEWRRNRRRHNTLCVSFALRLLIEDPDVMDRERMEGFMRTVFTGWGDETVSRYHFVTLVQRLAS